MLPDGHQTAEFLLSKYSIITRDLTSGASQACFANCYTPFPDYSLSHTQFLRSFTTGQVRNGVYRISCNVYNYGALTNWATRARIFSLFCLLSDLANGVLTRLFLFGMENFCREESKYWHPHIPYCQFARGCNELSYWKTTCVFLQVAIGFRFFYTFSDLPKNVMVPVKLKVPVVPKWGTVCM